MSILSEDHDITPNLGDVPALVSIVGTTWFDWFQGSMPYGPDHKTDHIKQTILHALKDVKVTDLDFDHVVPVLDRYIKYQYKQNFKWRDISKWEKRYIWKRSKYSNPVGFVLKLDR